MGGVRACLCPMQLGMTPPIARPCIANGLLKPKMFLPMPYKLPGKEHKQLPGKEHKQLPTVPPPCESAHDLDMQQC